MTNLDSPELAISLFLGILLGGTICALILRSWRVGKWRAILARPASAFQESKARWKSILPTEVNLKSDELLFEVLYRSFSATPKLFAPEGLNNTLVAIRPVGAMRKLKPVIRLTEEDHASSLVSLDYYHQDPNYVPVDVVAGSVIKNFLSVVKGKKKLRSGVEDTVVESFGAGGSLAGAKLGGALSVFVAPLMAGMASFAFPALMLFGAWAGATAGKKLRDRVKARKVHAAMKSLRASAKGFRKCFLGRFPEFLKQLDQNYDKRAAFTRDLYRKRQNRLMRFVFPDLLSVFLKLSIKRLRKDRDENRQQWKRIRRKVRFMPALDFAHVLHGLGEKAFASDAELLSHYRAYETALAELDDAKKAVVELASAA